MKHFIGRQILSVVLRQQGGAFERQHQLSLRFHEDVVPALERLFDRLAGEEQHILIDKLEIDLGVVTNADIQSGEWVQTIVAQVEAALLRELHSGAESAGTVSKIGRFDRWLYFLQHGSLPRLAAAPHADWQKEILDTLGLHADAVTRLRKLPASAPQSLERLVMQYPTDFLVHIVELLTGYNQQELAAALGEVRAFWTKTASSRWTHARIAELTPALQALFPDDFGLDQLPDPSAIKYFLKKYRPRTERELEIRFWRIILQALFVRDYRSAPKGYLQIAFREEPAFKFVIPFLASGKSGRGVSGQSLSSLLRELAPVATDSARLRAVSPETRAAALSAIRQSETLFPTNAADPEEGWHITLAGVVLLHPFFVPFFKNRELLESGSSRFRDDWSAGKAAHLLYYLAHGEENPAEYQLTLAKLLCGIPLSHPLDYVSSFQEEDKAEADALLVHVVQHWGALGNTSPAGLREGFLMRDGKLTQAHMGWRLEVERKTIDILLEKVPWGFGIVKTPWMKDMLLVEWNK